jgi:hypothetical protein
MHTNQTTLGSLSIDPGPGTYDPLFFPCFRWSSEAEVQNTPVCVNGVGEKIFISREVLGKLLGEKIVVGGNFSTSRQILHLCLEDL